MGQWWCGFVGDDLCGGFWLIWIFGSGCGYGCSWLTSCSWVVVLGWQWLWIVPLIGLWCFFFFCSRMYYFIIVDILFYCDVYIILLY